jgi:hypothetical protein
MIDVERNLNIVDVYGEKTSGEYCGAKLEGSCTVAFFTERISHHAGCLGRLVPYPESLDVRQGDHDLIFHAKKFHQLKNMLSGRTDLNIRVMCIKLEDGQFIVAFDIHPYSRDLARKIERITFPIRTVVRPAR